MPAWDEPDWAELAEDDLAIDLARRASTNDLILGRRSAASIAAEAAKETTVHGVQARTVA